MNSFMKTEKTIIHIQEYQHNKTIHGMFSYEFRFLYKVGITNLVS
jgi:hypothetical protein